jgi:hypothetical protein
MTQQEIQDEILKCKESPYYFATKYLKVKNHKNELINFSTLLTEKEFNKMVKNFENGNKKQPKHSKIKKHIIGGM